jgi:hypothetical protein
MKFSLNLKSNNNMKKIFVVLAMLLTVSAFAGEDKVSPKVLEAFNQDFVSAQQVEWTAGPDFYKASFAMNGQQVFAYYRANGDLLGLTRNISTAQLPLQLQGKLKKNYDGYWVSGLFELANTDGTSYYITLENADIKMVLKSSNGDNWTVFQKSSKA